MYVCIFCGPLCLVQRSACGLLITTNESKSNINESANKTICSY